MSQMKPKSLPPTRARSEAKSEENKRAYDRRKAAQQAGLMAGEKRAAESYRTLFKAHKKRNLSLEEPRSMMKPIADAYVPIRAWIECKQDRDQHAEWLKKHNLKP